MVSSLKHLHFKLGQAVHVDLLTHTRVEVRDYNKHHGPEQCKGPHQSLCLVL